MAPQAAALVDEQCPWDAETIVAALDTGPGRISPRQRRVEIIEAGNVSVRRASILHILV